MWIRLDKSRPVFCGMYLVFGRYNIGSEYEGTGKFFSKYESGSDYWIDGCGDIISDGSIEITHWFDHFNAQNPKDVNLIIDKKADNGKTGTDTK